MGRILFLSAIAFLAYRYIGRSNRKAREIGDGKVEILPPVPVDRSAVERLPQKAAPRLSAAVETDLGRR